MAAAPKDVLQQVQERARQPVPSQPLPTWQGNTTILTYGTSVPLPAQVHGTIATVSSTSPVRDTTKGAVDLPQQVSEISIEVDFYGWLYRQASILRYSRPSMLDWENLAEELEAMGRSEESALQSYLENLLVHLLKWRYQSNKRSGSWEASIENSRRYITDRLERSPSLKSKIDRLFDKAYKLARSTAGGEMGLDKRQWNRLLPVSCEWNLDTIQSDDFWPEASDSPVQN